ncbi:GNAT family N-acetyltransferase [Streptomyces sp. RPA4-5]|uniref:GNAT family N-acetyltransferase n=1 Tax=Streptomyces sp. RPA4-5 TaxID=2721245 RepID=UPI0032B5B17A
MGSRDHACAACRGRGVRARGSRAPLDGARPGLVGARCGRDVRGPVGEDLGPGQSGVAKRAGCAASRLRGARNPYRLGGRGGIGRNGAGPIRRRVGGSRGCTHPGRSDCGCRSGGGRTALCAGRHQPVGAVSEIVGVGTLPTARRRGLGLAVTASLVADARSRGVETVFLSAGDEDVARLYARLGFRRIATALIGGPGE